MKNRIIAAGLIAASILSYSSSSFAQTKKFPDVPAKHWGEDSIYYLVDKGAVTGNDKGMFEPEKEITRAEAATMMAKILNLPIDQNAKPSFGDSQKEWYTPFIAAVEKAGVVKGKGPGVFDPTGKIDRVSMASMLVEAYKLDAKVKQPLQTKFADLNDSWGKDKANILVELNISQGVNKTEWLPNKTVTKAEAAQFIAKADSLKVGNPLEEKVVIIDPGHGGFDPGNPGQGVEESRIVFDTSLRLQKLLEKNTPLKALLTREENGNPGSNKNESLANRVKFGQENNGDIFVSIHANSSEKHDGHGTETYYYKKSKHGEETQIEKDSEVLAKKIQKRVVEALHTRDRNIKDDHSLYVVNNNTVPAVLTELAFIDNNIDNGKLANESGRQIAAEAVYAGILDYYEWKGFDVSKYRLAK
ncbi:N-acetylmuramoyl-L-alanine amidase [Bacillus cereus]|uniref:N-acetylmuramoyl-L-alanine amidase n=1 Tax=Bacillus cereus TaxID=1396 RepID=UPI0011A9D70A|nr:N-acetylmuramoyl-L-alanine amidase [Bacillus cereus]